MDYLNEKIIRPNRADSKEYDCGNGNVMFVYNDIDYEYMHTYIEYLGRELDMQYVREINGNIYSSFKCNDFTLIANWTDGELRLIFDAFSAPFCVNEKFERQCETTLWQFETDHTLIDCGMCYIIRCCDGSFFIVDSGHFLQMNDNDRIHRFLRERTPDGEKIRIAGWFLTHAHSDHICKFSDFLKYNMDDCVLEAVYYNFPEIDAHSNSNWNDEDINVAINFKRQMAELKEIPQIKLHTGQCFDVRNLKLTVLCTHEDVFPQTTDNFNDTSTVLMLEAEGCRVLLPGDAGALESELLENHWGELLKCDILQVSHHGHFGCSKSFYDFAKARVALFPNTRIFFERDLINEKEANAAILSHCELYRVSSEGTTEIALPYVSASSVRDLPDETFEDFDIIHRLWGYEYTDEFKKAWYEEFLKRSGGKEKHYLFYNN